MPAASDPPTQSLSGRLRPFLETENRHLRLDELVARIDGDSGPGPTLFVLTLPVMLPLPPGVSMVMSLPLLVVAPQIAVGRERLWLPNFLSRQTIKQGSLDKLLRKILPPLERLEKLVRPRHEYLTGRVGSVFVGGACTLIAIILVLPIPFANLLPSWSLAAFSLGLTRKDGLAVLAGYGLLIAALAVITLAALGFGFGIGHLRTMLRL